MGGVGEHPPHAALECGVGKKKLDEFAGRGLPPGLPCLPLGRTHHSHANRHIGARSIKLTNEPPQGLKANLKRAFASFEKDEFEFKDPKVKSILFGLCHFHSVMIERIKFGPKGWNKSYPFSTGDLMCSNQVLANYLESGLGQRQGAMERSALHLW